MADADTPWCPRTHEGAIHMRGSGLIWTIVGILLIIALLIFIF
ncbi:MULTISPECIES: hypothetical protein [unclassified Serinicoccus]